MFSNQRVLFITTKNIDYIRNTQEIKLIQNSARSLHIIGSAAKGYFKRLLYVYHMLLVTKSKDYDVVFVGFAPQLVLPFFAWKFRKNVVIIDFFISMFDTLCNDRKRFRPDSIAGRLLHRIDAFTLSQAATVICDTNAHGEYFADEFGCDSNRLKTLYLEADSSVYYPRESVKPAHIQDKFVVLYFGSILPLQGVDVVLDAYARLMDNPDIYMYCIGPVKSKAIPQASNIEYIEWLSQEELAQYISYADLCLAGHFNADIDKAKRTIPGKAYIYSAMNKPMILGDNPANHELYDSSENFCFHNDIQFVEMGNSHALADAILRYMEQVDSF